ncbi:hypothetical protein AK830_g6679 [Neonectria ditissima]|uniref:Uncharacterized protein n=1 Tax=Neonectria ditissima TaxID=78410 RepID=A0A0P7AZS9_9HYPO|nr:hypothetical protein AK830_g6679 [Neonectria ditissima]
MPEAQADDVDAGGSVSLTKTFREENWGRVAACVKALCKLHLQMSCKLIANRVSPAEPEIVFDQYWSEQDEASLCQHWENEKAAWEVPSDVLEDYRTLWVVCIKWMACSPWEILGPKNGFRFEPRAYSGDVFAALAPLVSHVEAAIRRSIDKHLDPGGMSGILEAIGDVIESPAEPTIEDLPYLVTATDCRNIAIALESAHFKLNSRLYWPPFLTTTLHHEGVVLKIKSTDKPVMGHQLQQWHEVALKDQLRYVRREENMLAASQD